MPRLLASCCDVQLISLVVVQETAIACSQEQSSLSDVKLEVVGLVWQLSASI